MSNKALWIYQKPGGWYLYYILCTHDLPRKEFLPYIIFESSTDLLNFSYFTAKAQIIHTF